MNLDFEAILFFFQTYKRWPNEIEKHYISKGYTAEDAKTVTSDVMSQALSYELFMGEVSHNFADDMLGAFQNEVQNLLGSSRVKNSSVNTEDSSLSP